MEIKEINEIGTELIKLFKLDTSPVAVTLIPSTHELPEGISRLDDPTRHCQMVDNVRYNGDSFYTLIDDHKCKGGAATLGFCDLPQSLKSGDLYFKLKRFSTINAARRTMEKVPVISPDSVKAIAYAPLEKTILVPDVIVIISNPETIMKISQSVLYKHGGRITADFAGIQSICGDGVAEPYNCGTVGITVGCSGSRKHTSINENEMIIGIPFERLNDLYGASKKMLAGN